MSPIERENLIASLTDTGYAKPLSNSVESLKPLSNIAKAKVENNMYRRNQQLRLTFWEPQSLNPHLLRNSIPFIRRRTRQKA